MSYIYAYGQVLSQYDGDWSTGADKYFYLHDRLGSVRQLIGTNGDVVKLYTYEPFGEILEIEESAADPSNLFRFTGQYYDSEIAQYFLRARQYDPHIGRFTARDPVFGKFEEPLTLHAYLYCMNDPVNWVDPTGLRYRHYTLEETQSIIELATLMVGTNYGLGPLMAFGPLGPHFLGFFDVKENPYWYGDTFTVRSAGGQPLRGGPFGNYLAGYTTYYHWGIGGEMAARAAGVYYAGGEWALGLSERPFAEEIGSQYWITVGALDANIKRGESLRFSLGSLLLDQDPVNNWFINLIDRHRLGIFQELFRTEATILQFNLYAD